MTGEGLKACKSLSAEGIPVNVTLVFSPNQAILAAKAGATCSPISLRENSRLRREVPPRGRASC